MIKPTRYSSFISSHLRRTTLIAKITLILIGFFFFIAIFLTYSFVQEINKKSEIEAKKRFDQNLFILNPSTFGENYETEQHAADYRQTDADVPHFQEMPNLSLLPDFGKPGEYGMPVILKDLTAEEEEFARIGWARHGFNELASHRISLHRRLPDVRPKGCRDVKYSSNLPKTSIIIIFHNEAWSTLVRTLHSVLDRTPPHLIEEILLVDDFSEMEYLGQQLENYIKPYTNVKLVRSKKREGSIRTRLLGASVAKAKILTYLDSHCECSPGWLEPLLQRVHENWTTLVSPVIDNIQDATFQYHIHGNEEIPVGGFTWDLQFDWQIMPLREKNRRKNNLQPIRTPTMAGGLFVIHKDFFEQIGTYDDQFDIWGGDNLELSFKVWMCGGSVEIVPCSHVGHVFRLKNPNFIPGVNSFRKNCVRLAEVWLDDYKHYFYRRMNTDSNTVMKIGGFGDISERKKLKESLNCKSFQWFLENVTPEQYVPDDAVIEGQIRNFVGGATNCLEGSAMVDYLGRPLKMSKCNMESDNQYFILTSYGEIRRDQGCLDYINGNVIFYFCYGAESQYWTYDEENRVLIHNQTGLCLEITLDWKGVTLGECTGEVPQIWGLQNYDKPNSDL